MENIKPKFSIIMACYNNERYLLAAISSAINQTYTNWELIIVDDASTDNSYNVAKGCLTDRRIRLYKNKKNYGCGFTKRKAVEYSNGGIVGILDADDALEKNALEKIVEIYLRDDQCGCVYSNYFVCNSDLITSRVFDRGSEAEKKISNIFKPKASHFLTFSRKYYEKTTGFDLGFKTAEDKDLIYKLEEVTKLLFINEPLYYYRIHQNGVTYGRRSWEAAGFRALAQYRAFLRRRKTAAANFSTRQIANILMEGSFKFFIGGNYKLFVELFNESWKIKPFNVFGLFFSMKGVAKEIKHELWSRRQRY